MGPVETPRPRRSRHIQTPRVSQCVPKTPLSTGQHKLTPNNDAQEREETRRAKNSKCLQKSLASNFSQEFTTGEMLTRGGLQLSQLSQLLDNCLRLAADNKITEKNVWALPLIDHFTDIVHEESQQEESFNFQKVGCGLDVSVRIYSTRVESAYKQAYSSLQFGDVKKRSQGDDNDACDNNGTQQVEGEMAQGQEDGKHRAKHSGKDLREQDTLADPDSIKMKDFDQNLDSDPLFQQMTKLFDEGGAQGLLLNNLSVYRNCLIMFDSQGVPQRELDSRSTEEWEQDKLVHLGALQGEWANLGRIPEDTELTPSIYELYDHMEDKRTGTKEQWGKEASQLVDKALAGVPMRQRPTQYCQDDVHDAGQDGEHHDEDVEMMDCDEEPSGADCSPSRPAYESTDNQDILETVAGPGADGTEDLLPPSLDLGIDVELQDDLPGDRVMAGWMDVQEDGDGAGDPSGVEEQNVNSVDLQSFLEDDVSHWLLDVGANAHVTRGTGWAGASFWRYCSATSDAALLAKGKRTSGQKRVANKVNNEDHLNFDQILEVSDHMFEKGTKKDTCLATTTQGHTLLPEDLHYDAKHLSKLFLKPNATVWTLAPSCSRGSTQQPRLGDLPMPDYTNSAVDFNADISASAEDYDDDLGGGNGDLDTTGPVSEDLGALGTVLQSELLQAPRQTQRLDINYTRKSKQVDVRALKEVIWDSLNVAVQESGNGQEATNTRKMNEAQDFGTRVDFRSVIAHVPQDCPAGELKDLSVHLCFICLLHLANENDLSLQSEPDLRTLTISNVT